MENTNQKNTGNIQIAPVSAASDLNHKREGYLTWDEYFMGVAMLSGMRSKDPNSQVGACIVSDDNKILSMGYNGFPKGCSDDEFPWAREGEPLDTKYLYVTHSELNAILNYRGGSLEGAKMYVTLFPCNECAFAYIKFIKPKQGAKVSADPDDYEFEDEEYENEDVPEQGEQEDQN